MKKERPDNAKTFKKTHWPACETALAALTEGR